MASSFLPVLTDVEKASIRERQPLPDRYLGLSDEEMDRRIAAAKAALGPRLLILGHHYQRDEVIKFADITGDSYRLLAALRRASRGRVHRVLRCPLHGRERRRPVARRISRSSCRISRRAAPWPTWPPSTSSKRAGRSSREWASTTWCRSPTSTPRPPSKPSSASRAASSARRRTAAATLRWAWERGKRILFLPDQHLGRNTAYKMGVPLDDMVVWDPDEAWGGLEPGAGARARLILWKGHCSVHTRFTRGADRRCCASSIPASA